MNQTCAKVPVEALRKVKAQDTEDVAADHLEDLIILGLIRFILPWGFIVTREGEDALALEA